MIGQLGSSQDVHLPPTQVRPFLVGDIPYHQPAMKPVETRWTWRLGPDLVRSWQVYLSESLRNLRHVADIVHMKRSFRFNFCSFPGSTWDQHGSNMFHAKMGSALETSWQPRSVAAPARPSFSSSPLSVSLFTSLALAGPFGHMQDLTLSLFWPNMGWSFPVVPTCQHLASQGASLISSSFRSRVMRFTRIFRPLSRLGWKVSWPWRLWLCSCYMAHRCHCLRKSNKQTKKQFRPHHR